MRRHNEATLIKPDRKYNLVYYFISHSSKDLFLIWRRQRCRCRATIFRPMFGPNGLWAGTYLILSQDDQSNQRKRLILAAFYNTQEMLRTYSDLDLHESTNERANYDCICNQCHSSYRKYTWESTFVSVGHFVFAIRNKNNTTYTDSSICQWGYVCKKCKCNTLTIFMHQMCISTPQISSAVLRSKKLEIQNKTKKKQQKKKQQRENCKNCLMTTRVPWNWAKSVEG
jgi:hypothetical protein